MGIPWCVGWGDGVPAISGQNRPGLQNLDKSNSRAEGEPRKNRVPECGNKVRPEHRYNGFCPFRFRMGLFCCLPMFCDLNGNNAEVTLSARQRPWVSFAEPF